MWLFSLLACSSPSFAPRQEAPPLLEPQDHLTGDEGSCGFGAWGRIPIDENTIFVQADAAPDGDGSEAWPFQSLQEGANAAGERGGGLVAVAAGQYTDKLIFGAQHAGVHVVGRCKERVILDGSAWAEGYFLEQALIRATLTSDVSLAGVTIQRAGLGISVVDGGFTIKNSRITQSGGVGFFAYGDTTWVSAEDLQIDDAVPREIEGMGYYGIGMFIQAGAELVASRLTLHDNVRMGIYGLNSTISLDDTVITQTRPAEQGEYRPGIDAPTVDDILGVGIFAVGEAGEMTLSVRNTHVEGNAQGGIFLSHTNATLDNVEIRDTWMDARHPHGGGLLVSDSSTVVANDLTVEDNDYSGIYTILGNSVHAGPSTLTLQSCDVRGTRQAEGSNFSAGVVITNGTLEAHDLWVADNDVIGLGGILSTITLSDSIIEKSSIAHGILNLADIEDGKLSLYEAFIELFGFISYPQFARLEGAWTRYQEAQEAATNIMLTDSDFQSHDLTLRDGDGIVASLSQLHLEQTSISSTTSANGIYLQNSQLYAKDLKIFDLIGGGLRAYDSTLQIQDLTVHNISLPTSDPDVPTSNTECQSRSGQAFEGCGGWGFAVHESKLTLQQAHISATTNLGMVLSSSNASLDHVQVEQVEPHGSYRYGIGVGVIDSTVTATELSVVDNQGVGLYVMADTNVTAHVTCHGCRFSRNGFVNVGQYLIPFRLYQSAIGDPVTPMEQVSDYGLWSVGGDLHMVNTIVYPHAVAGLLLGYIQSNPVTLQGNVFYGVPSAEGNNYPHGTPIFVHDSLHTDSLSVVDNQFLDSEIAIFLHHAAGIFEGNTFSNTDTSLWQQNCLAKGSKSVVDMEDAVICAQPYDHGVVLDYEAWALAFNVQAAE